MQTGSVRAEINISEKWQEYLIADLAEIGFTGFEQYEHQLVAYISEKDYLSDQNDFLDHLSSKEYSAELIGVKILKAENWNAIWEATIKPTDVGQFHIRPTWESPAASGTIELVIDPKMAFGTGYHATTRLMLRMLSDISFTGKEVLDAGTGTGILAIAALKLGARHVFAFDVDPWSKENATENSIRNGCDETMTIKEGDSSVIPEQAEYDVILANINRNALIELIPELAAHLTHEGILCVSGLLSMDRQVIQAVAEDASLTFVNKFTEGEWISMKFYKSGSEAHRE